jgi:hypothetical protein
VRILFDFLADTDRFHPASMRVPTLRKELDRAAARFPAAMADPSVWRLAKRVFMAMGADGVDRGDDAAVDDWAAAFSAAPAERRRAVLGVLLDRQPELLTSRFAIRDGKVAALAPGSPVPPEFHRHDPDNCAHCLDTPANPPIALPPVGELAGAARESTLLRTMLACGHWAAAGRPVTKNGFPPPADTQSLAAAMNMQLRDSIRDLGGHPGLLRAWRLALDAEVLRLHRTAVVAGPGLATLTAAMADTADPDHILRVWKDLADIAVTGPTRLPTKGGLSPELDEFIRPWGPRALGELYRNGDQTMVDELVEKLIADYHGSGTSEMLETVIGAAVRNSLLAASEAGIATVTVPPDADADPELAPIIDRSHRVLGEPAWAVVAIPGTRVELTALGRYFVRQNILTEGTPAPLLEPVP